MIYIYVARNSLLLPATIHGALRVNGDNLDCLVQINNPSYQI